MKRKHVISFLIVVAIYFLINQYLFTGIKLTDTVPTVFEGKTFTTEFVYGMTYIYDNGKATYPMVHDNKALYILNGAGNDFKKYEIHTKLNEIVIWQNLASAIQRNKKYFQVVAIPNRKIQSVIQKGKIMVRINYIFLGRQYTLVEYDLAKRQSKVVKTCIVGK